MKSNSEDIKCRVTFRIVTKKRYFFEFFHKKTQFSGDQLDIDIIGQELDKIAKLLMKSLCCDLTVTMW